jgi:hypothetical protein
MSYSGKVTTYDLTVGEKIDIDELIYMISPVDSPLINGLAADGKSVLASSGVTETTFKWMDEEILLPRAAADAANSNTGTAVVVVSVSAADSYKFQVGDLVTVMDEGAAQHNAVLRITAVNTTTGDLTVEGWANHADQTIIAVGDIVTCLGTALAEGSDPGTSRSIDRVMRSNYTQIFGPTPMFMSRTEQQISRYGVADEFSKQVFNRSIENVITREQAYLYGQAVNDTTNKMRSTGGLSYFLSSNVDSSSTTLTRAAIETQLQTCYNNGGVPDLLIANPASLATLNDTDNTATVRHTFDDPRRGRVSTMSIFTEFGDVTVTRNRWCNAETAFLVKKEGIQRRVMQPLVVEALAKTGDSDKVQIVCEEGLQLKGQTHMARFSGLTSYTGS